MGAIFSVPVARVASVAQLPAPRVALVAEAPEVLRGPARGDGASSGGAAPGTLVVGAEREGLPEEVVAACDAAARIEIAGDSLNAAMAATIGLYEWTRGARGGHMAAKGGPPGRASDTVSTVPDR